MKINKLFLVLLVGAIAGLSCTTNSADDITIESEIVLDLDTNRTGVVYRYWPNGILRDSSYVVQGKRNGWMNGFHKNGTRAYSCYYLNDSLDGPYVRFDSVGKLDFYKMYSYGEPRLFFVYPKSKSDGVNVGGGVFFRADVIDSPRDIGDQFQVRLFFSHPPESELNVWAVSSETSDSIKLISNDFESNSILFVDTVSSVGEEYVFYADLFWQEKVVLSDSLVIKAKNAAE